MENERPLSTGSRSGRYRTTSDSATMDASTGQPAGSLHTSQEPGAGSLRNYRRSHHFTAPPTKSSMLDWFSESIHLAI